MAPPRGRLLEISLGTALFSAGCEQPTNEVPNTHASLDCLRWSCGGEDDACAPAPYDAFLPPEREDSGPSPPVDASPQPADDAASPTDALSPSSDAVSVTPDADLTPGADAASVVADASHAAFDAAALAPDAAFEEQGQAQLVYWPYPYPNPYPSPSTAPPDPCRAPPAPAQRNCVCVGGRIVSARLGLVVPALAYSRVSDAAFQGSRAVSGWVDVTRTWRVDLNAYDYIVHHAGAFELDFASGVRLRSGVFYPSREK
jgi:hypothetical protein